MPVRELRWEDFDGLVASYFHLYDERRAGAPIGIPLRAEPPSQADEVAWFARVVEGVLAGDAVAVVGEVDGRAVGLCEIRRVGVRGAENDHVGELGILVDHRHRGRGLGRAMLARALELARGRFELVRLGVFATNDRAKALYASFGFRAVGRYPAAFRRNGAYVDEELMVLDLRPPPPAEPNR